MGNAVVAIGSAPGLGVGVGAGDGTLVGVGAAVGITGVGSEEPQAVRARVKTRAAVARVRSFFMPTIIGRMSAWGQGRILLPPQPDQLTPV